MHDDFFPSLKQKGIQSAVVLQDVISKPFSSTTSGANNWCLVVGTTEFLYSLLKPQQQVKSLKLKSKAKAHSTSQRKDTPVLLVLLVEPPATPIRIEYYY